MNKVSVARQPIVVWPLSLRLCHMIMALAFFGAYWSGESDRYHLWHLACGWILLFVVGFRLYLGFVGNYYVQFRSFLPDPRLIVRYLRSLIQPPILHFTGHNPAGAVAIYAILILGTLSALSGAISEYDWVGGVWGRVIESSHEALTETMMVVIGIHLIGVVVSSFWHRENLPKSMITGIKMGHQDEAERAAYSPLIDRIYCLMMVTGVMTIGWLVFS